MAFLVFLLLIVLLTAAATLERVERPVEFGRRAFHEMFIHAVPQHSIFHSTTGLKGWDHDTVTHQEDVLKSPQPKIPSDDHHKFLHTARHPYASSSFSNN